MHEGTDFCLSFPRIPNPDFERRFRTQYANDFLKLETLSKNEDLKVSDDEDNVTKRYDAGKNMQELIG